MNHNSRTLMKKDEFLMELRKR